MRNEKITENCEMKGEEVDYGLATLNDLLKGCKSGGDEAESAKLIARQIIFDLRGGLVVKAHQYNC